MRAGIEPGEAASQDLNREVSLLQILFINVGDFQFASSRRFKVAGNVNDLIVVKVETSHRVM